VLTDRDLQLRPAVESDKESLWELIYGVPDWKETDAPYYPLDQESLVDFGSGMFGRFRTGEDALLIDVDGQIVGAVTCYWEDKTTRWLEVGITLYSSVTWGKRIGRRALSLWISHLFEKYELERIGLTTWSGNPSMIASAESIGLQIEGCLRKVRYYQGEYYDSIKMGVLREEWKSERLT
jgi:RimJ/RimL family protein N-acetyltransferase